MATQRFLELTYYEGWRLTLQGLSVVTKGLAGGTSSKQGAAEILGPGVVRAFRVSF